MFGQQDQRQAVKAEHRGVIQGRARRGMFCRHPGSLLGHHKKTPVPAILDKQEHGINAHGHEGKKHHLEYRERRARGGARVVGEDEPQHGKRKNHHEKGVGALEVVLLFLMAKAAQHQGEP